MGILSVEADGHEEADQGGNSMTNQWEKVEELERVAAPLRLTKFGDQLTMMDLEYLVTVWG